MNNLLKVFKIVVPGQLLDDKLFFQYSDFDSNDMTKPTDANVADKAVAYTRMQQVKRKLSELAIPVYCTVEFTTAGTSATVPTDATINVAYISYEPFVSTVTPAPVTDDEKITAAQTVIAKIINDSLAEQLTGEMAYLQKISTVLENPLVTKEVDLRDVFMQYIDVPAVTTAPATVTFVKL